MDEMVKKKNCIIWKCFMRKRLKSNIPHSTITFCYFLFYWIRNHLSHILFEWQYFSFKAQFPGPGSWWSQSSDLGALRTPPCALRRASRSYVLRAQGPEIRFGREKLWSFETRLRERHMVTVTLVRGSNNDKLVSYRDRENVMLHISIYDFRLQVTLNWIETRRNSREKV